MGGWQKAIMKGDLDYLSLHHGLPHRKNKEIKKHVAGATAPS